jgi:hypothetical protein
MIEKNKNYTVAELKALLGDDWSNKAGIVVIPRVQNKPVINSFDEFDPDTKHIYTTIKNLILNKNSRKAVNVWASGSRVKGTWRTKEEAELNKVVKYSDYDYCTDAPIIPSKKEFAEVLTVPVDFAGCEGHKVLL